MREDACCICGGRLDQENRSICASCGGAFHQPWSVEASVPACGRIYPHQEALGLVFLCLRCASSLGLSPQEPGP